MFVKVRDEFQQPVSRKEAWVSIFFVVVLIVGIGITASAGKHSVWDRWFIWLSLGTVWASVLFQAMRGFIRHKRWVYPLPLVALLVGVTLNIAGHELPRSPFAASWVQSLSLILYAVGLLPQFLEWKRHRPISVRQDE